MLAAIRALIATGYIFSVALTVPFLGCAFDKAITLSVFSGSARKYIFLAECLASGFADCPLHLIMLKLIVIVLTRLFGGFSYTLSWIALLVDSVSMAGLIVLFIESLGEKEIMEEALKDVAGGDPVDPLESILSARYIKRLLNPFWRPDKVKLFPNITYATNEEAMEALATTNNDFNQPRKMMLDVYASSSSTHTGMRPVLLHIHGGAWRVGSKNIFYPHEKVLVAEDDWVVVNIGYRLAPINPYPTHLMDVKRALRWVKQNISSFGGDPNFIVLSGDSAGGHLAAMTALTENDPAYQPGFEEVDTSVKGVISFNGALDIRNSPSNTKRAEFFAHQVAMLDTMDEDFIARHSPVNLLCSTKETQLVPFLVFSSERDALVDWLLGQEFKQGHDTVTSLKEGLPQCHLVKLPTAHHIFYAGWSPRSLYASKLIQAWCQQLYVETSKNK